MNIETIDKWLNEEYGCSYTRLEELLEFYTDREMKFKERINKAIDKLNNMKDTYYESNMANDMQNIFDLLDILKGGKDNE